MENHEAESIIDAVDGILDMKRQGYNVNEVAQKLREYFKQVEEEL
jgi:hypothetical protein